MTAKPKNYPQPDMGGLTNRKIKLSSNRASVEGQLFEWTMAIVKRLHGVSNTGVRPEVQLMNTSQESIDVLMRAAPISAGMRLGPDNGMRMVHANFQWNRQPDGHWIITQICFDLVESKAIVEKARQLAYADSLRDAADRRAEMHINVRKVAYPVENYPLTDFTQHIKDGEMLVEMAMEEAVEAARHDVAALENPVEGPDMMLDAVTMGVGHLGELSKGAKELAEVYEGIEKNKSRFELAQKLADPKKSTGDKGIEVGLGIAGTIPVAGPFIKVMAGIFFDQAIAGDAARITRLRSRLYVFFVAGYMKQLTFTDTGRPLKKVDAKYFNMGMAQAPKNELGRVKVTTALLHYATEHYTAGGWGGLSFHKQEWEYPDRYMVEWSPALLGRAMATQLHTRRNLYENEN